MFRRPPIRPRPINPPVRPRPINPPGEFIPIPKYQLPIRPPEGIYPPRPIDGNPIERPLPYRPRLGDLLKDEIEDIKKLENQVQFFKIFLKIIILLHIRN